MKHFCIINFSEIYLFAFFCSNGGQDIFGTDGGHWHNLLERCQPCLINYDYVVRTETMRHDAPYIVNHKMIGRGLQLKTKARRKAVSGERSDFGRIIQEYRQIPEDLFQKIAKRYEHDMYVYGYNYTVLPDGQIVTECSSGQYAGNCCC